MQITKADVLRYFVIEKSYTSDLAEAVLKREFPEVWQELERFEGLEIDPNNEIAKKILKWREWHNALKEGAG